MRTCFTGLALAVLVVTHVLSAQAEDVGVEFFEKKIRPVLVKHCYECHSANAKKLGGGLLLDHREGLRQGGETGSAVVVGKPDESLLIKAIRYEDDSLKMPPKGKLPAAAIADLETWIKNGASDPREKPTRAPAADSWAETFRARREWWSLQSVQKPIVPQPKNGSWSSHPVDRFILAKLEEQGLSPAEPADPRTLARRLSLVLTGLPATPEQVASFVRDCQGTQAVEKLVDSLLDSPHFGERWARHWMDVVRFTETHGNEWNYEVHHAWRYRDYLIRAFNADVPYDQFIREHIAGDLLNGGSEDKTTARESSSPPPLPPSSPRLHPTEHFNESIIGTGFYRFGEVNHDDCISLTSLGYDIADNQIDTLTKAFQATTVACARCHNHKLDAVSMEDYYALLAVLRSSRMVSHSIDSPEVNADRRRRLDELKTELRRELAAVWLNEAQQIPRYMQAAQAKRAKLPDAEELIKGLDAQRLEKWIVTLAAEKQPFDDPFEPWRLLSATDAVTFPIEWKKLAERFAKEDRERAEFNQSQFVTFGDFRSAVGSPASENFKELQASRPHHSDWQIGGQGLMDTPSPSGDFTLHPDGDALVRAILPAGHFTHALSDKLNGTLRSPVLPLGKKHISFQVIGQRSSAVRLVSNNCQLNYKNYKALTSADWQWVTFSPPDERDQLRTYAELMTMFDNPKFPDQLSALGGDGGNYRLPWEKAAENPRSYFGIRRVVLHDVGEPPKPEVAHLRPLFAGNEPTSLAEFSNRTASLIEAALQRWLANQATDDDVRWLDVLLRSEVLGNKLTQSPRVKQLAKQYRLVEVDIVLPHIIVGISDDGPGIDQPIFARGDCTRPGETVPRRYLEALSPSRDSFTSPGSGRLELAQRIASADNPLTARVMVNRVWHHLFGTGLVRTVDDFGHVGEQPSHPELLDHLAVQFVEEGWSIKKLIRSLVLTRTFQLSNQPSAAGREVDPLNRLLRHYPARRLEAEAVRDSILVASGRLDRSLFGLSVQPYREKEYADRRLFPGPLDGNGRRSIYIKNNLMESPKFLGAFNLPGGKVTQGRRDVTNVPAQALALLNDPFVLQQADVWAERLVARTDDSVASRLAAMFENALSRSPTSDERDRFEQAVRQLAELHQVPRADVLKSQAVWKDVAHALFNVNEFIYIP
ncbi:MAG: PSD1 and planctomycete cytochrome C domain-containing protein [Planctomycetaceae bacterium]